MSVTYLSFYIYVFITDLGLVFFFKYIFEYLYLHFKYSCQLHLIQMCFAYICMQIGWQTPDYLYTGIDRGVVMAAGPLSPNKYVREIVSHSQPL